MPKELTLKSPGVKVFVATSVMLTFISFWRAAAIVLSDLGLVGLLRRRRCREGHRQERSLVRAGGHAVQLRRAGHLHRVERDVRARRRLPRGQAGHGRHPGQAVGFGAALRLHSHRPDQLGRRRPVPRRVSHRHVAPPRLRHSRSRQLFRRSLRHRGDPLLLVAEHQGHSRVQRARAADHEDHHRDGGDADRLVPDHDLSSTERICRRCRPRPPFRTTGNRWAGCWAPGRRASR